MDTSTGQLIVVGIGIGLGQTTLEAKSNIEQADKVFYLASNPLTILWIQQLNPTAESLYDLYSIGKERLQTYTEMSDKILSEVRKGLRVCAAFYGHPGVFVDPSHRSIRQAKKEGYVARMLLGVSAEDCLFADLGIDPSRCGCQSFEATDFLIYQRKFDTSVSLILWQIGVIGDSSYQKDYGNHHLVILLERLLPEYGAEHVVTLYEASVFPICLPVILSLPLSKLSETTISSTSTLYIPPKTQISPNLNVLRRLNIDI